MSPNVHLDANPKLSAGRIAWLPSINDCDDSLLRDGDMNNGCFNHPVLILTADERLQLAVVLLVN